MIGIRFVDRPLTPSEHASNLELQIEWSTLDCSDPLLDEFSAVEYVPPITWCGSRSWQ